MCTFQYFVLVLRVHEVATENFLQILSFSWYLGIRIEHTREIRSFFASINYISINCNQLRWYELIAKKYRYCYYDSTNIAIQTT